MTSEVVEFVPSEASGLVSCICVTQPGRLALVQRAVLNFLTQDYPARELIIMTKDSGYAEQIHTFLSMVLPSFEVTRQGSPSISLRTHSFGSRQEAVVQAMAYAKGEWICIWDDDNLSHPTRIEEQLRYTPKGEASVLTKSLYFFYESSELFVSGFEQPGGEPHERCAPSSLIFSRQAYPGFDLSNQRLLKSDFPTHFIDSRHSTGRGLSLIPHMPHAFITCVHADNVRGGEFHRRAASGLPSTRLREWIISNEADITGALDQYQWPKADISVSGKDAQAFIYEPERLWPSTLEFVTVAESSGTCCPAGEPGEPGEAGQPEPTAGVEKFETQLAGAVQDAVLRRSEESPSVEEE